MIIDPNMTAIDMLEIEPFSDLVTLIYKCQCLLSTRGKIFGCCCPYTILGCAGVYKIIATYNQIYNVNQSSFRAHVRASEPSFQSIYA